MSVFRSAYMLKDASCVVISIESTPLKVFDRRASGRVTIYTGRVDISIIERVLKTQQRESFSPYDLDTVFSRLRTVKIFIITLFPPGRRVETRVSCKLTVKTLEIIHPVHIRTKLETFAVALLA
jgi:hypothetical protein